MAKRSKKAEEGEAKKRQGISKIVRHIQDSGANVGMHMRRILNHFYDYRIWYFHASGFVGSRKPDIYRELSESVRIPYVKVEELCSHLERLSLLDDERGMGTPAGREYGYGFSRKAKYICELLE